MVGPGQMAQAAAAVAAVALMAQPAAAAISLCRDPVIGSLVAGPNITVWGQDTMVAFGSGYRAIQGAKPGIEGPWVAPLITGLVMFLEAWYIAYKGWVSKKTPCLLYWLLAFYPFATGLVEFARVNFDASRYGFLTATWHNLPEYVILAHLFLTSEKARKAFPYILVWVWFLDVFIMFVPSLDGVQKGLFFGGLVEQLTGICCDHLLLYTFGYLWWSTKKETEGPLKLAYWYGVVGAFMHMLEIVPLVILLTGLVHRPYIPICVLVAFTSPITFYFYGLMADELINDAHEPFNKKQDIAKPASTRLLVVGIILGLLTILGPVKLVPACDVEQRPFVEDTPAPSPQYCPSAYPAPAAAGRAAVPADAFATTTAAPPRGYASYVQNTYTQGKKLYDIPGAGQVYASSLPVLADLDWQIIQSKIEPSHAMVPIYSDAPILIWVVSGKMSALITEGNGFSQGVQQLGTGDVLALKKGMIYALENSGTTTLQTVTFINTAPSVGKFKGTQVLFPLFGPQGPLASLTSDMSASAFNTTTSEIDALRRKYSGLPLIFKVTNGPRYVSDVPATSGYTLNMDTELAEHGLNSPGAGGVSVGNNTVDNWAILTDLGFTPVNAYIRKGSLLATHTHVGSVEIDVITKGFAEVQLVTPSGELVTNQLVGPGDVFVIPPGYSHVHRTPCTPEGDHAFVAIQSDLRFHTFFVSGAISVFKPFVAPEDAAALSHQSKVGFTHDYKCVI